MEPNIPAYINEDFLTNCLHCDERYKKTAVVGFSTSLAAPAGNNYGGVVVRVKVDYKEESSSEDLRELSLIVKGPHTEGPMREVLSDIDINHSEPLFYNTFLPAAYKLLNYPIAPETLISPIPSVVVMEDLKQKGYVMADRTQQLDFEHCSLYMTAGAAFHAVSHALYQQNPDLINSLCGENVYCNDTKAGIISKKFIILSLECLANHIPNKRHASILIDRTNKIWDELVKLHKPDETFNALIQGDPWTTNMMFKYDDGGVSNIKLLDFQNLSYSSPIHDLVFFIWSSANHEVRRDRLEDLYVRYFENLTQNLKTLNCIETVTYNQFKNDILKFSPVALYACAVLPGMINPKPMDFADIFSQISNESNEKTENPFEKSYVTDNYCQIHLPHLLDDLERSGIFEYLENF